MPSSLPYEEQDIIDETPPLPPNDPETTLGRMRFRAASWRKQPPAPSPKLEAVKVDTKPDTTVEDADYYKLANVSDTKLPGLEDDKPVSSK